MTAARCPYWLLAVLLAALSAAAAPAAPSNAGLKPTRFEAYGKVHNYQLATEPVVGTMVLIHGCGPGANAFFPQDPEACPECTGWPEYVAQTKQSLARGYHVLALQSNSPSGCWSSSASKPGFVDDRVDVVETVAAFLKNTSMAAMPLYMQGYSSGGTMLLKLPAFLNSKGGGAALRIDGIIPTDAAPRGGFNFEKGLDFPPTLFVFMEGGGAAERAPGQVQELRAAGVPADVVASPRRVIVPTFFSDRIPGVTPAQSRELVAALGAAGALDASGYLLPGGFLGTVAPQLPWLADMWTYAAVDQEMQVARGEHQNLGEFTTAALAWLESGGKADIQQLLKELVPARMAGVRIDQRQGGAAITGAQELPPGAAKAPAGGPQLAPAPAEAPTNGA
ncbi:hypothetical protein ABPG75_011322 [Micractinium tetrahymenae]